MGLSQLSTTKYKDIPSFTSTIVAFPLGMIDHWHISAYLMLLFGWFCACAKSLQSCPTLCDPMDCSPPCSPVHGILQARIVEWVAMPSSRGYSPPRGTHIFYASWIGRWVLYHWATWETLPLPLVRVNCATAGNWGLFLLPQPLGGVLILIPWVNPVVLSSTSLLLLWWPQFNYTRIILFWAYPVTAHKGAPLFLMPSWWQSCYYLCSQMRKWSFRGVTSLGQILLSDRVRE